MNPKLINKQLLGSALGLLLMASGSHAASLSLMPSSSSILSGAQVTLDLRVSGLLSGEDIESWNLWVEYDPAVFAFDQASSSFGSGLGAPLDADGLFIPSPPNQIALDEISFLLDFSAQPESFTLATLAFNGISIGSGDFFIVDPQLNGFDFTGQLLDGNNVSVSAVPVPGALWLMGPALLAFARWRKPTQQTPSCAAA